MAHKRTYRKSKRPTKGRKGSRKGSKKCSKKCRRGSRRGRRFGRFPGLLSIMGNNPAQQMSSFQIYTGMPPGQMDTHLANVDPNLRDTFYANTV
jgi:hypothetical protein